MATGQQSPPESANKAPKQRSSTDYAHLIAIGLGIVVVVASISYALLKGSGFSTHFFPADSTTTQPSATSSERLPKPHEPETHLTPESIDLLLDALDQAIRRKDVDGVLQHIAHDAIITIHMKQGPQQQTTTLTREEYRKTLAMEFAIPTAHDFARVNTTVSLAHDLRSAKVSFKSTQTLRQANRELKIEGEETLVLRIGYDKLLITSLDKVVPGDST